MEFIMAMLMAEMAILVFMNVVMRYAFHSGVSGTEEIARLSFIWLSFIGAVVVMISGGHLGVDMLLQKLSPKSRLSVGFLGRLLMGGALGLLAWGSWQQIIANDGVVAMGALPYPLAWNYAAGLFAGVGGLLCVLRDIVRLAKGDSRFLTCAASEDEREIAAITASIKTLGRVPLPDDDRHGQKGK
ncbi:TRAP transporter small permease [Allopusillimonas ginsengisoli]|uniref:TRAP transporter small permease n=1 Tax=Allopusillimonas ginsengisoli TaxID=453575 RepID=UPI001432165A|nr:TRAP transporter small permease [Allopusillimonas ginsengisoli]